MTISHWLQTHGEAAQYAAFFGRLALLVLVSIVVNLGYRQITVWWRVRAFYEYWRGDSGWGQMERRGLSNA